MKSFLEYVADDIIGKYGTDLSRTAIVFPNKRASLFLNEYLARAAQGEPVWSPVYITISDLFRQHAPLTVADPVKLVCDLHLSFCQQTDSTETLDKFYGWGQLLISDFDDMDKNMADAERVFANLRDIHEFDDLTFLTDEQRSLLQRFFSHFTESHETELKQRFLRLWSRFADIYRDFNERLAAQGFAYEGALYRHVVSTLSDDTAAQHFPYERYLFVGFNLLQKVEQQLFSFLQKQGKAFFYWDVDHYYLKQHEAGQHIARYLQYFPNELDTNDPTVFDNFRQPKQLTVIAAPTEHIQARYVSTWLRQNQRAQDGRRTAIVMCNEVLLPTVLHSLPDEVSKVNVTTGYPLSQTPVTSFIQTYFNMLLGGNSPRLVRAFLRHPYVQYVEETDWKPAGNQPENILVRLLHMLRKIAQGATDKHDDPLFQESLFRAYKLVNRLNSLKEAGDLDVTDTTLQRLINQLIQQTTIPFHGEPAEGLQVMGVLETRNLDFDHVLLLSCNEGNMPRGVNDASFIPHAIRRAYELTTVDNKVSIYAYYFHRLLQRAHDVTIVWNNSTEDGQRGEMSRFVLQLMVESGHPVLQQVLQAGRETRRMRPTEIPKTPQVMTLLSRIGQQQLSPSAINRYMRCPHQFYYQYIAGIKEPDLPDDELELDNRTFGNVFHQAADTIYHQLPPTVTRQVLERVLADKSVIARAVDEAFAREMPHAPKSGLHIINREVIIRYLRQLVQIDMRLAPFTVLGLECDVRRQMVLNGATPHITVGGRIDRLDQLSDGRIRVVDYKTGSRDLKPLAGVEAIFDPAQVHNHADYYLQTFVYADIVSRQQADGAARPVSPALLFIQHAAKEDYDPTLFFGKDRITDVAVYRETFDRLLTQKIEELFSPDVPFTPTADLKVCRTCPYLQMCRR